MPLSSLEVYPNNPEGSLYLRKLPTVLWAEVFTMVRFKRVVQAAHRPRGSVADFVFVKIPYGTTTVGNFAECHMLREVDIPGSVTHILPYAFQTCIALESIKIPSSVTEIGNDAFRGCCALKHVDIPESVARIGRGAFYSCTALENIKIPNFVTSIEA